VYFLSVVRAVRLVTPVMVARGGGSIVDISSFAAFEPDPDFPTSAAARAGLESFTRLFADRYAHQGVRMNNVLPGFVDSLPETEARHRRIPMGRYARISEVTALVVCLASPESSRVTGQNIRVDGDLARRV